MGEDGRSKEISVEAYSGYRANERPLAVTIEGRRCPVHRILDRRRSPESDAFLVELDDGRRLWVAWDGRRDRWHVR